MLNEFGAAINLLGLRVKPYLPQISGTLLKSGLNNKSLKVRQQAADLISIIAVVMKQCEEEQLMGHLGVVLYEYLGEEDPEVLGSVLGASKAILSVIDLTKMSFSLDALLSRLIPILENRHEKVEKNCIELVGCIATRGAEYVSERQWMIICHMLHEMLNAPQNKEIHWAAVNTFEYITEAIGPQKVLDSFLYNLRVRW
ncbi:splicing factor 3B subunit 1 [Artemisia annua]|uniref:Splicing factor 3B subunit 1 n=1 Tax=Artemisia annua TaxID=35608 RepID=A0A2U1N6M9_ARTAN|nr:splicing factor 3B subunit 1 [Artemisia annua]